MTEKMHYATYGRPHRRGTTNRRGDDRALRRSGQGGSGRHGGPKTKGGPSPAEDDPRGSPRDVARLAAMDPAALLALDPAELLAELDDGRRSRLDVAARSGAIREGGRREGTGEGPGDGRDGEGLYRIPRRERERSRSRSTEPRKAAAEAAEAGGGREDRAGGGGGADPPTVRARSRDPPQSAGPGTAAARRGRRYAPTTVDEANDGGAARKRGGAPPGPPRRKHSASPRRRGRIPTAGGTLPPAAFDSKGASSRASNRSPSPASRPGLIPLYDSSRSSSPSIELSRSPSLRPSRSPSRGQSVDSNRRGRGWDGRTRHYDRNRGTSFDAPRLHSEMRGFDLGPCDGDGRTGRGRDRGRSVGRSSSIGRGRSSSIGRGRSLSLGRRRLGLGHVRSLSVGRRSLSLGRRRAPIDDAGGDGDNETAVKNGVAGGAKLKDATSFLKQKMMPLLPVLGGNSCKKRQARRMLSRDDEGKGGEGGGCEGDGSATFYSDESPSDGSYASYCGEDSCSESCSESYYSEESGSESDVASSDEEGEGGDESERVDKRGSVSFPEEEPEGIGRALRSEAEEEEVFRTEAVYCDDESGEEGSEDSESDYEEEVEYYSCDDDDDEEGRYVSEEESEADASGPSRSASSYNLSGQGSRRSSRGRALEPDSIQESFASARGSSRASSHRDSFSSSGSSSIRRCSYISGQSDASSCDGTGESESEANSSGQDGRGSSHSSSQAPFRKGQRRLVRLLEENESLRASVTALRSDFESLLLQMRALENGNSGGAGDDGESIATDANSRVSHCLRRIDEVKALAAAKIGARLQEEGKLEDRKGRTSQTKMGGMDSDLSVCAEPLKEGNLEGYQEFIDELLCENERLYDKIVTLSKEREEILQEVRALRGSADGPEPVEDGDGDNGTAPAPDRLLTAEGVATKHGRTMDEEVASLIEGIHKSLSAKDEKEVSAALAKKLRASAMDDEILGLVSRILLSQRSLSEQGSSEGSNENDKKGDEESLAASPDEASDGKPFKSGGEGNAKTDLERYLLGHSGPKVNISVCTVASDTAEVEESPTCVIDSYGVSSNSLFDGTKPSTRDPAGHKGGSDDNEGGSDGDDETLEIIYEYESDEGDNSSSSTYQDCYDEYDSRESYPSEDVEQPPRGYHRFSPNSSRESRHSRSTGRSRRSSASSSRASRPRKSSSYSHCSSYAPSTKSRGSGARGQPPSPVRSRASSKRSSVKESSCESQSSRLRSPASSKRSDVGSSRSGRRSARSGRSSLHSRRSSYDASTKDRVSLRSIIEEAKVVLRLRGHNDSVSSESKSEETGQEHPPVESPEKPRTLEEKADQEERVANLIDGHLVDSVLGKNASHGFDESACMSVSASSDDASPELSFGSESTRERKGICITVVTRSSKHVSFPSSIKHTYVTFFRADISKEQVDAVLEEQFQETREVLESSIATDRLDNRSPGPGVGGHRAMKRRKYQGEYNSDGERHGYGIYTSKNGNEYRGEWQHDKREGLGVVKIGQGDIFEGQFEGNLKNGIGVYHYADGECDLSRYRDDLRVGDSVRYSKDRATAFLLSEGSSGSRAISLEEAASFAKDMGTIVAY